MEEDIRRRVDAQRSSLVRRLESRLDVPLAVLGLAWLALLVFELTLGLSPFLARLGLAIWVVFVIDFGFKFALAPDRVRYLRRHWLTALSLAIPALRSVRALRALRVLRAARTVRGLRLLRLVTSWNRGMRALGRTMRLRGFGYVMLLTLLVLVSGAAGMYAFERGVSPERGIDDYGSALWWTAMILATMGSEYWPRTPEGRLLCLLLAVYGFTVFGYVTAALASFFISRDTEQQAVRRRDTAREIAALRRQEQPDHRA